MQITPMIRNYKCYDMMVLLFLPQMFPLDHLRVSIFSAYVGSSATRIF